MDTAKYADTLADMTDDSSRCELCRGPLADDEPWVCNACAIDALEEPSDEVKMRAWEMTARVFAGDWSVIGLASIVAALVFGAGMLLIRDVQATDGRTVTRTIQGHPHEWTLPEAGCNLLRAWEDHSATAWCPSGLYAYDPDGSKDRAADVWYAVETAR